MAHLSGTASLPLHGGAAPVWLFRRMVELAKATSEALVFEFGTDELLRRLSNPYWFQSYSCILGFDWHSSGTTTVTCGALKEALAKANIGIVVAGGKGKASKPAFKTLQFQARNLQHQSPAKRPFFQLCRAVPDARLLR